MHYYISLQSYHIINISFRALRALIKSEIRTRDRLRKAYGRTHKQTDLTKYKRQRNKVNNMKAKLKEQYYDSMNESLQNLNVRTLRPI